MHNFIWRKKKAEWKDNHLIFETHSKGLLMKDLLVSTRPSYQRLLMKLSTARMCRSTFWFFCWKWKVKRRWHFPVPCPPLPGVGRRIRTNWRRHFGPCQSLTSLPYSFWLFISLCLSLPLFPCCAASLQKVYIEGKKKKKSSLTHTPLYLPFTLRFRVFISCCLPSSSPCFTFSP